MDIIDVWVIRAGGFDSEILGLYDNEDAAYANSAGRGTAGTNATVQQTQAVIVAIVPPQVRLIVSDPIALNKIKPKKEDRERKSAADDPEFRRKLVLMAGDMHRIHCLKLIREKLNFNLKDAVDYLAESEALYKAGKL